MAPAPVAAGGLQLRVLLPGGLFLAQETDKLIAEAPDGCFCLLPHHIDCVSALVPGLCTCTGADGTLLHLALDAGTLVKRGRTVTVAVPRAARATAPGTLAQELIASFTALALQEREARNAAARLDTDLLRRCVALRQAAGFPAAGGIW